jgi:hypothetical protein
MNHADEMKLVADLEPAMINRLAEDGYARRRNGDVARALAEGPGRAGRHRWSPAARGRWRGTVLTGAVAVTAAAAVAVAVVVTQAPASRARPSSASARVAPSSAPAPSVRAGSGTYWYSKERDFGPTTAGSAKSGKAPLVKTKAMPATAPADKTDFGARLAYSEEIWMGQASARTITNENAAISFTSPAGEAAWKAAGKPPLFTAYGFSDQPVTSNYHMSFHWGVGSASFSWADLQRLKTGSELGPALRRMWDREPDKAGQFGSTSYSQYIFQWAGQLLTSSARPAIKAAMYQLLAAQPGLAAVGTVTDPDGRSGLAVSDGAGDFLIISPATAQAMAYGTGTLRQGEAITAGSVPGIAVYEAMGWTTQLGVPARA